MKTFHTREFEKSRHALHRSGAKSVTNKLNGILVQLHTGDDGADVYLTSHGESRISSAKKYDLGDGCRLVTQVLADGEAAARVVLFVGSHDDTEMWLERHRGYKYVLDPRDKRIELVPVDVPIREAFRAANVELAPSVAAQPLLRHLTEEDWAGLVISAEIRKELLWITHLDFADSTVEDLLGRLPPVVGEALFDIMVASNDGDLDRIRTRVELFKGKRKTATSAEVIDAIGQPINSDQFITFEDSEDLQALLEKDSWEAWMLFLHPVQLAIAQRSFSGPSRVRGVSGSGKTSVLIHRARWLARRYRAPIQVVTLTRTLSELLGHLLDQLCGVERSLITVSTAQELAFRVLQLKPEVLQALRQEPAPETARSWRQQALREAITRGHLDSHEAGRITDDHLVSLREDYMEGERDLWVTSGARGAPSPKGREVLRSAAKLYDERLQANRTADSASLVLMAIDAAAEHRNVAFDFSKPGTIREPFARCVLVDEAQDLSLNELRLVQAVTDHMQADALFLASDSAQRVYRRRSTLATVGIDVRGRAHVLQKNYRNTLQIFRAARALLEAFDVNELDDDSEGGRIPADYAAREGDRPLLARFDSVEAEVDWVAEEVSRMRRMEAGVLGAGVAIVSPSRWHRERIGARLQEIGVPTCDLRDDVIASSDTVKISTVESAKGHEFSAVFIAGLSAAFIPHPNLGVEERARDVARLYVAMTRARECLTMTWSRDRGGPSSLLAGMIGSVQETRWSGSALELDEPVEGM